MKVAIIAGIVVLVCGVAVVIGVWFFIFPSTSNSKEDPTQAAIRIAQEKCSEYAKVACNNPIPSGVASHNDSEDSVSGRKEASEGTHPHMARLFMITISEHQLEDSLTCGAALISEYFVMTDAVCAEAITQLYKKENTIVTLGSVNIGNKPLAENYTIDKIIIHDGYEKGHLRTQDIPDSNRKYDIALLKFNKAVSFTWSKRPICLNTNYGSIDVKNFIFTGFGYSTNEPEQSKLRVLDQYTDEVAQQKCSSMFNDSILSNMICARHLKDNRSLCQYDLGGPLATPLKKPDACANTYELVGVASYIVNKHNCGPNSTELPIAFYVRVDKFIHWIVSNVWPDKLM